MLRYKNVILHTTLFVYQSGFVNRLIPELEAAKGVQDKKERRRNNERNF